MAGALAPRHEEPRESNSCQPFQSFSSGHPRTAARSTGAAHPCWWSHSPECPRGGCRTSRSAPAGPAGQAAAERRRETGTCHGRTSWPGSWPEVPQDRAHTSNKLAEWGLTNARPSLQRLKRHHALPQARYWPVALQPIPSALFGTVAHLELEPRISDLGLRPN